jgi:hypothetical protein
MTSGELLKIPERVAHGSKHHSRESPRNWSDRAAPSASLAHALSQRRTQASILKKDAPIPRAVQVVGRILPTPILGGLHHQYVRI